MYYRCIFIFLFMLQFLSGHIFAKNPFQNQQPRSKLRGINRDAQQCCRVLTQDHNKFIQTAYKTSMPMQKRTAWAKRYTLHTTKTNITTRKKYPYYFLSSLYAFSKSLPKLLSNCIKNFSINFTSFSNFMQY